MTRLSRMRWPMTARGRLHVACLDRTRECLVQRPLRFPPLSRPARTGCRAVTVDLEVSASALPLCPPLCFPLLAFASLFVSFSRVVLSTAAHSVLARALIASLLLRGGVEANPGPNAHSKLAFCHDFQLGRCARLACRFRHEADPDFVRRSTSSHGHPARSRDARPRPRSASTRPRHVVERDVAEALLGCRNPGAALVGEALFGETTDDLCSRHQSTRTLLELAESAARRRLWDGFLTVEVPLPRDLAPDITSYCWICGWAGRSVYLGIHVSRKHLIPARVALHNLAMTAVGSLIKDAESSYASLVQQFSDGLRPLVAAWKATRKEYKRLEREALALRAKADAAEQRALAGPARALAASAVAVVTEEELGEAAPPPPAPATYVATEEELGRAPRPTRRVVPRAPGDFSPYNADHRSAGPSPLGSPDRCAMARPRQQVQRTLEHYYEGQGNGQGARHTN